MKNYEHQKRLGDQWLKMPAGAGDIDDGVMVTIGGMWPVSSPARLDEVRKTRPVGIRVVRVKAQKSLTGLGITKVVRTHIERVHRSEGGIKNALGRARAKAWQWAAAAGVEVIEQELLIECVQHFEP